MENAERDRMLANDPDHEEGEMYSGSDGDYDGGRRGVEYRSRRGSGKEFVDARELIRESRRARSRSADSFSKTIHAFMRFDLVVSGARSPFRRRRTTRFRVGFEATRHRRKSFRRAV